MTCSCVCSELIHVARCKVMVQVDKGRSLFGFRVAWVWEKWVGCVESASCSLRWPVYWLTVASVVVFRVAAGSFVASVT